MEKEKLVSLVSKAQKKDPAALNVLFNEFYNDVYYFALKTVKDEDTACDITQETFVEIIKTIENLKEPAAFVTWMKQITYHQCTRYFKKKKDVLVDETEDESNIFDTVQEDRAEFIPDEGLEQDEFKKTIISIIDELTEEQRSAIMMYYFDELSVNEIAEIQGVSVGTVKSRLNYGRKAIKNSVEEYEDKNGIKLHAIPFFPFFKWLFEEDSKNKMAMPAAKSVAKGVSTATKTSIHILTKTAIKFAAIPLFVKVTVGVLALIFIAGGVTVALLSDDDNEPASNDVVPPTVLTETTPAEMTTLTQEQTTVVTTQTSEQTTEADTSTNASTTAETTEKVEKTTEKTTEKVNEQTTEATTQKEETTPVLSEDEMLELAKSAGRSYSCLPYFDSVSELSMQNIADYIYTGLNIFSYNPTEYNEYYYYYEVPVSDYEDYSQRIFGKTYNFKELDGKQVTCLNFTQLKASITYNESRDTLIHIEPQGGGGDIDERVFEVKKIDDTNYVVSISETLSFETPPEKDIPYETWVSDYDGMTYYKYTVVDEIRLVYVNGTFRPVSYVAVDY